MLVKCIDNTNGYERVLTIGEIYYAEKGEEEEFINVEDAENYVQGIYIGRFKIIEQN